MLVQSLHQHYFYSILYCGCPAATVYSQLKMRPFYNKVTANNDGNMHSSNYLLLLLIWDFLLRSLNKLLELQKSQFIQSTENTFTHRTVSLLSRCCRTVSLKSAMMSYTTPAPFIAPTNNVPIWAGLLETITLAFSRASILDPAVPWRIFKTFVNSNLRS